MQSRKEDQEVGCRARARACEKSKARIYIGQHDADCFDFDPRVLPLICSPGPKSGTGIVPGEARSAGFRPEESD